MASLRDVAYVNPIIGSFWSAMSQILTQEITRLRALPNVATMVAHFMGAKDDIGINIAFFCEKLSLYACV
jgi:CheY-specific phosphatase CheX